MIECRHWIGENKFKGPRVIVGSVRVRSANGGGKLRVELRRARGPSFEVRLVGRTRYAIENEVALVAPHRVETGGFLWSHYRNRLGSALVCYASGPGPNARHGRSVVTLSRAADVEATFGEFTRRAGLIRAGDWHSHPSRSPRPSEHDLQAWASALRATGLLRYLGRAVRQVAAQQARHAATVAPAGARRRVGDESARFRDRTRV